MLGQMSQYSVDLPPSNFPSLDHMAVSYLTILRPGITGGTLYSPGCR